MTHSKYVVLAQLALANQHNVSDLLFSRPMAGRIPPGDNAFAQPMPPTLVVGRARLSTPLFLCSCSDGLRLRRGVLGSLMHDYLKRSGIGKIGSCDLSGTRLATLMLENGADIRYVQQMLGHVRLNTTEVYTHVNIQKLIEVHRLTHPAKLPPPNGKAELEKDPGCE